MKTLMVAALTVAAVGANVAFAEEDDGIVSAAPVVADPVNPQQGMLANAYNVGFISGDSAYKAKAGLMALEKASSVKSFADKATSFTRGGVPKEKEINIMKWDGFIKCKRAASYTFSFDNVSYYSVYINGQTCVEAGKQQVNIDVDLKLGWNKIVLVQMIYNSGDTLKIQYRPKGSLSDPRSLSPGMMFYDKPVEEEW